MLCCMLDDFITFIFLGGIGKVWLSDDTGQSRLIEMKLGFELSGIARRVITSPLTHTFVGVMSNS